MVLASKTPDGVHQQIWAHLLVHRARRILICRTAAAPAIDPDRLSFTETLRAARRSVTTSPGVVSPEQLVTTLIRLRDDLLDRLPPPWRLRAQPRVVKRKMSNYQLKRAGHHTWPQPTRPPTEAVTIRPPSRVNQRHCL
ncbi:hypothetical protein HLK59_38530 [Streptomyces sp. S3(2020)]|uniref:hypothetical protein n=1 Tax=Streptomyces sp. S3(2020) TaxID=2732044 RepID=UPI001488574C|nr:hypothetical protein [Streptomyces sp. S3(2020)]NNN36160.1 hypothetical protein [Streptomyces sp. S3(2020)]